jgi:hypothetical protein
MTSSGVMITAFGLGASNTPRSDVFYLDLRDPIQSSWSWKSVWSVSMLDVYTPSSIPGANTNTNTNANTSTSPPPKHESKSLTSIIVPVVVGILLALPIILFFIRRKVRIAKKRREARHFSFSSQEDNGDFNASSPHRQFRASNSRSKASYPFGRTDANEREGGMFSGLLGNAKRVIGGMRRRDSDDGFGGEREMIQRKGLSKTKRISEKQPMNWEEIDFGLGKLDERRGSGLDVGSVSRKSSFSASGSPPMTFPFPMPIASTLQSYSDELYNNPPPLVVTIEKGTPSGTPTNDGQAQLIPSLAIIPPSGPATPAAFTDLQTAYPSLEPTVPKSKGDVGLDWNNLAQELESRPAFRSISPTSTLKSHQHPSLPPQISNLEFQPNRVPSPSGSITLINPKTGRRTSDQLPFPPQNQGSPRTVSQPNAFGARHLAGATGGGYARRGSVPYNPPVPGSSGSNTPLNGYEGVRRGSYSGPIERRESVQSVQSKLRVINADGQDQGQAL